MTRLFLLRTTAISMICIAPLLFWQVIQKQKGTSFTPASIGLHGEMIPVTESGDRVNVMNQPGMWLNQEGREVFLSDFRGKAAVMAFIYTHCVDTCSLLTLRMKELELWMPEEWKERVQFILISIDPERDDPPQLKQYASMFETDPSQWHFLTSEEDIVRDLAKRISFYFEKQGETFIHQDMLALIDRQGNLRSQFWGVKTPDEVMKAMRKLEAEGGL